MLRRRRASDRPRRRPGILQELDGLLRRALIIPVAAPVLLLAGLGLGRVTSATLDVPENRPVRNAESAVVPRIRIESLNRTLDAIRVDGERTLGYLTIYRDEIQPVEAALRGRGVPERTARRIAWPLVKYAQRRDLDPATVLAVMMIESRGKPNATSPVGARGLMQVMPGWEGHWQECGIDLYDIEHNLCAGTRILQYYLRIAGGDERKALLGYNGCIRGTFTPDCWLYPDKVDRIRRQILREWETGGRSLAARER